MTSVLATLLLAAVSVSGHFFVRYPSAHPPLSAKPGETICAGFHIRAFDGLKGKEKER